MREQVWFRMIATALRSVTQSNLQFHRLDGEKPSERRQNEIIRSCGWSQLHLSLRRFPVLGICLQLWIFFKFLEKMIQFGPVLVGVDDKFTFRSVVTSCGLPRTEKWRNFRALDIELHDSGHRRHTWWHHSTHAKVLFPMTVSTRRKIWKLFT